MSPIFRLGKFPHVCRLCLQASDSPSEVMISLNTKDPVLEDESIGDFITAITFVISEDKNDLLPKAVCLPCLELLRFFAKYRSKINIIHLFLNSLIELRHSNFVPMLDLFRTKSELVRNVITDLGLCNENDYSVHQLIQEFKAYADSAQPIMQQKVYLNNVEILSIEHLETNSDIDCISSPNEVKEDSPLLLKTLPPNDGVVLKKIPTNTKKKAENQLKLLKCDKCDYSTSYKHNMKSHQQTHIKRENRQYPCREPSCTEIFTNLKSYQRHQSMAHKSFVCEICGLRHPNSASLKVHMDRHMQKYEHVCPYCQKGHNTKSDLRTHISWAHEHHRKYSCETCGLTFRRKTILDEHILTHNDTLNFTCKICDKKFKRDKKLQKHIRVVHEMVRFNCSHCSSTFQSTYSLKDHIEIAHGIQMRFLCDICVQLFDSQGKLDVHRARHDNASELECPTCLVLFRSADEIEGHLCITYRDDYICCGRDFRYHYFYNKHIHIKHGIRTNVRVKPIPGVLVGQMKAKRKRIEVCPKCEKVFNTRTQKKQHLESCSASQEEVK